MGKWKEMKRILIIFWSDKLFCLWVSSIAFSMMFFLAYSYGDAINTCTYFLTCEPGIWHIPSIVIHGLIGMFSGTKWMLIHFKEGKVNEKNE